MKYVIKKEIEAPTLSEALKRESKAEIVDIFVKEESKEVGFRQA